MAKAKQRSPARSSKKAAKASPKKPAPKAKAKSHAKPKAKSKAKPAKKFTRTKAQATSGRSPAPAPQPRLRAVLSAPWPVDEPALDDARFLEAFPPMPDVVTPSKASLAKLGHRLPKRFLEFFERVGFGRFGSGFLTLLHPHVLDETLADWLGGFDPSRVPFARTALGDLLFFRDLRGSASMLGVRGAESASDIGVIVSRHKATTVIAADLPKFFNEILGQPKMLEGLLRKDLFDRALPRLGSPDVGELYGFVPAVTLGGAEEPGALERVNAQEHLSVLRQL